MKKDFVKFERVGLFVRIKELCMRKGELYRGMHLHSTIEVVEVKKGSICCCIGEKEIHVNANETILINSNVVHKLISEYADIVYTHVELSYYENTEFNHEFIALYHFISSSKAKVYMVFSNDKELSDILGKIKKQYYRTEESSRWYLRGYIYELIAFMHEHSFIMPVAVFAEEIKKIETIVRYIDANFKSPIALEDICNAVPYSKYTVCHNFKAVTGATVFEYINFLRISHAISKLKKTNDTISEIASCCGFSSITYFNRVFKNIIGCTPSVYRRNVLGDI